MGFTESCRSPLKQEPGPPGSRAGASRHRSDRIDEVVFAADGRAGNRLSGRTSGDDSSRRTRRQKHDRRDAELLLRLLVANRFPSIFQSLTDWAVGRLRQIWKQLGTTSVPTGPRPASERFRPHGLSNSRGIPVMPERPPVSAVLPAAGASFRSTESSFVAGLLNTQPSSTNGATIWL